MNGPEAGIPRMALERGTKLSEGMTVYGKLLTDMTKEELIAVAALGWDAEKRANARVLEAQLNSLTNR